jgi:hypothetical protein
MMQRAPAKAVGEALAGLFEHPVAGPPTAAAVGYIGNRFYPALARAGSSPHGEYRKSTSS